MAFLATFLDQVQLGLQQYVFQIFQEPKVAIGLALALLVFGMLFVGVIFWRWLPTSYRLMKLEKLVRASATERDFVERFNEVDEAIDRSYFAKHGWSEFKETLIFPESESGDPIRNTTRPSVYLNLNQAEASGLHLRFLQAVPNYFVGAGLVFTFLGLVAAIYFANEGIGPQSDIRETQESLSKLLDAATFKFLTSIAGILSSLLIAISYRFAASHLQERFDSLCVALEECLLFVTPESIAFRQYKELQKQTVQLERFNTDFAFSVAKEIDSRLSRSLPGNLERALQPLAATIHTMAERLGEVNQDAMSSMVERFSENLQQSAGEELKALGASLNETRESLSGLVGALQSAGGQLNITLGEAGNRLQSAASAIEQSLRDGVSSSTSQLQAQMERISSGFHDQFTSSSAKFSAAIRGVSREASELLQPMQSQVGQVTLRLESISKGLNDQIASLGELNTQLGSLIQNTAAASERLKDAGEPVQAAAQAIHEAAGQITTAGKLASESHVKLAELAKVVAGAVEETTKQWADYQRRFEQVDKDLASTFKELHDGTTHQQEAIKEFVKGVDQELDKALRNLAAGVGGLQDNLEEFTNVVEQLGGHLSRQRVAMPVG